MTPKIAPFKGIIYNQKKIKRLAKVVSPPYDVISFSKQTALYKANPHNIVRIDFGKIFPSDNSRNNRYTRANKFMELWKKKGVLVQDQVPAVYLYAQDFASNKRKYCRWGFIARFKLEDGRSVLAHERTSKHHKNDRLELIKEVKANFNPVFTLFEDSGLIRALAKNFVKSKPFIDIRFEDVRHRLWRIMEKSDLKKINKAFTGKHIYIADGHHRFEVSCAYRNYCKKKNISPIGDHDYVMMYFSALRDPGLVILPTHRLIKNAPDIDILKEKLGIYFDVSPAKGRRQMFSLMQKYQGYIFGMYLKHGKFFTLRLKKKINPARTIPGDKPACWKKLDVSILHALIVEGILKVNDVDF
ncbi:MAG: DUF1015 domain-containing protein, partial [Candidatus Omnitrophica bacterium]|nr:DUF1015 domain-containing protein [Candidatus Omnitrophota bacterium]